MAKSGLTTGISRRVARFSSHHVLETPRTGSSQHKIFDHILADHGYHFTMQIEAYSGPAAFKLCLLPPPRPIWYKGRWDTVHGSMVVIRNARSLSCMPGMHACVRAYPLPITYSLQGQPLILRNLGRPKTTRLWRDPRGPKGLPTEPRLASPGGSRANRYDERGLIAVGVLCDVFVQPGQQRVASSSGALAAVPRVGKSSQVHDAEVISARP